MIQCDLPDLQKKIDKTGHKLCNFEYGFEVALKMATKQRKIDTAGHFLD